MIERDEMFERAREYIKSGDHEGLILGSDINDEIKQMVGCAKFVNATSVSSVLFYNCR